MDTNKPLGSQHDRLQFDQIEPVDTGPTTAATCVACRRGIVGSYFEIAGKIVCQQCKDVIIGGIHGGSRLARFSMALLFGVVAAAGSAALWLAITKLTGWQIGLIAVLVGLAVGGAVRAGAKGRGGWLYQGMAIILTYLAITASYVPEIIAAFQQGASDESQELVSSEAERSSIHIGRDGAVKLNGNDSSTEEAVKEIERLQTVDGFVMYHRDGRGEGHTPASADIIGGKWAELDVPAVYYADADFQNADPEAYSFGKMPPTGKLFYIGTAFVIAIAVPFLTLPGSIIGLLIIGFALWEAWKINKRQDIHFSGPYALATRAPANLSSSEPFATDFGGGSQAPRRSSSSLEGDSERY